MLFWQTTSDQFHHYKHHIQELTAKYIYPQYIVIMYQLLLNLYHHQEVLTHIQIHAIYIQKQGYQKSLPDGIKKSELDELNEN